MAGSRRRGAELDSAIFDAVLAELEEVGYHGLTFEGVARRAGTSKPVLYRRWSTRLQMVTAAIVSVSDSAISSVDTGSLSGDLRATLRRVLERLEATTRPSALGILADAADEPEARTLAILQSKGTALTDEVVARARSRGEIGHGELPERVRALPFDLARYEFLINASLTPDTIDEIVDAVAVPLIRSYAGVSGSGLS